MAVGHAATQTSKVSTRVALLFVFSSVLKFNNN